MDTILIYLGLVFAVPPDLGRGITGRARAAACEPLSLSLLLLLHA